jgi:hypothetical protein
MCIGLSVICVVGFIGFYKGGPYVSDVYVKFQNDTDRPLIFSLCRETCARTMRGVSIGPQSFNTGTYKDLQAYPRYVLIHDDAQVVVGCVRLDPLGSNLLLALASSMRPCSYGPLVP